MRLPDFVFIGPDKTGSSWMWRILSEHPDVFVPMAKDLYFFDRYFEKGLEWYASYFAGATADQRVGELSHDYLFSDAALARISTVVPDAVILTCLRDPIDRAFSQYLYMQRSGMATGRTFLEALGALPELVENSRYSKYLPGYIETFEHVVILRFDTLRESPVRFGRQLLEGIGVEYLEQLPVREKVRAAGKSRSPLVSRLMKRAARLVRDLGLANLVGLAKNSRLLNRALYSEFDAGSRPVLTRDEWETAYRRLGTEVDWVERELGWDVAGWRRWSGSGGA